MKKTILAALILSASTLSFAEYVMKFPLEQSQGGSLPNGSIQFVSTSEPTEPETPVDPLDAYFSNTLNATIDFYQNNFGNIAARTNNKSNISSVAHQDLTLRVEYSSNGFYNYFTVLADCGDCTSKVSSLNVNIGGNNYNGVMCSISYVPYNALWTLSDYTSINCRVDGVNGLVLNGTPYSITFN